MKLATFAASAACAFALSGCATIIKGSSQSVAITTPPVTGATCNLSSSQGNWMMISPGAVTVERSREDIQVRCDKPGYQEAFATIPSNFEGWTAGNLILGGIVGLGVDAASGAINQYPHAFQVPMIPGDSSVAEIEPPISSPPPEPTSAHAILMKRDGGTYVVPVTINNAITLDFAVDSGAADVVIPGDVLLTLMRTGTIGDGDFIEGRRFQLADGSTFPSATFRIRSLKVGDMTVSNVTAALVPDPHAQLLLGQSFLGRFGSWSVDNRSHSLMLNGHSSPQYGNTRVAEIASPPSPSRAATLTATEPASFTPLPKPAQATPPSNSTPHLTVADGTAALKRSDYPTALAAWKPLAEQGNPLAENGLGYLYQHGYGVAADTQLALTWYRKAAVQGSSQASDNIGSMYENGDGVQRDPLRAYMWYSLAVDANAGDSALPQKNLDRVAAAISAGDITKAKKLADNCQKSNFAACGD